MAIRLIDQYPSNAEPASTDYPHGSFRNDTDATSTDGTPLEQAWGNDWNALFQALIEAAGITPNGTVDTVPDSQLVNSLIQVAHGIVEIDVGGSSDVTLDYNQSRIAMLRLTGTLTADVDVIVPDTQRAYLVINDSDGSFDVTIRTDTGTGVVTPQGVSSLVRSDGTNVVSIDLASSTEEQSVDSVSILRSSSFPSIVNRLWLYGYNGIGTAGGGPLDRDSADTTTADNGIDVFVDTDGVRWKRPDTYRPANWSNHAPASHESATSFRLTGDWTGVYQINDWVELFGGWSGGTLAIVDAAPSLSGGDTIVSIEVQSGTYDNTLASVRRSAMDAARLGASGQGKFSVRIGGRNGSASGDNAVAIGDESNAPTLKSIAIGNASDTTVDDSGDRGVSIGDESKATGDQAVSLGAFAQAWQNCVSVGRNARSGDTASSNNHAVAIGVNVRASGQYAIAIGSGGSLNDTDASANQSIAIGRRAVADFVDSVAIGTDATVGEDGQIQLGNGYNRHGVVLSGFGIAGASMPNGSVNFAVTPDGDIQARWVGQSGTFNTSTIATGTS